MAAPQKQLTFPWITIGMLALAMVAFAMPVLTDILVYDRSKIFAGEFWRIFTGHCVHFSTSHLVCDAIALGVLGFYAEMRHPESRCFLAIVPWTIGVGLLILEPHMARFGGFSGIASAVLIFIALQELQIGSVPKWLPIILLGAFVTKTFAELTLSRPIFITTGEMQTVASTSSHVLGAATAAIYSISSSRVRASGDRITPALKAGNDPCSAWK